MAKKKYKSGQSLDIYAKSGTKVRGEFENGKIKHGHDHDQEHAMKYLKPDTIYTIDRTEVDSWHTDVYLKEFPNISFNSVHFIHS